MSGDFKYMGYTDWDLQGTRRQRIGNDCIRAYESSGDEQYQKAAARIFELQERIQQLETKAAALYTLAERTCGDGCHCMKENDEKCALMETDNG